MLLETKTSTMFLPAEAVNILLSCCKLTQKCTVQVSIVFDLQTLQARTSLCGISGGPTTNSFRPYWGIKVQLCSDCPGSNSNAIVNPCMLPGDIPAATSTQPGSPKLPTVVEPQLSRTCPTTYRSHVPSPTLSLQNIPYYTPICIANAGMLLLSSSVTTTSAVLVGTSLHVCVWCLAQWVYRPAS